MLWAIIITKQLIMKENLIENRQIRIFISSTFRDMHDERDYLMKRTFPRLSRIAAKRDVTVTEVDLRWGITEEESRSGKVVDICFREIDNSIPFFIGIIGNRYGWIPEVKELDENITARYPSVKGYLDCRLSVTEMEIQYGVLDRNDDIYAYFYIKNYDDNQSICINESEDAYLKLKSLKDAVRASRYPSSEYSSVQDLANQVEEAFIRLIDSLFPEENLTEHEKDKIEQHSFISQLSSSYVREEGNFKMLDDFAADDSTQFLVVTGESGLGKSALLANWAKGQESSQQHLVIPYFSSNGGNQSHQHIARYMVDELCDKLSLTYPQGDPLQQLKRIYDAIATKEHKVILVFDAINQIADIDRAKTLNWLPIPPHNVKYIFSTLPDDPTMDVFMRRSYPIFRLQKLSLQQRRLLIESFLGSFGKTLKQEQAERIALDAQCENTLVLRTLLEELVAYGHYDTLDDRIYYYLGAGSPAKFYHRVIQRLEDDFSREFVSEALSLIVLSKNGLKEEDIVHITGVKRYIWSDFFHGFSTHLNNQSGSYVFTHSYITSTIWQRYLTGNPTFEKHCRKKIVEGLTDRESGYAMSELPFQYDKLCDWDSLHKFITTQRYLYYQLAKDEIEINTYWRHIFEGTGSRYSLRDYNNTVSNGDDRTHFCSAMIRLCGVTGLEKIKKEYVDELAKILDEDPSKGTAELYIQLASCFPEGRVGIDYALKSLQICRQNHDIDGELAVYSSMSAIYYHKECVFKEDCSGEALETRLKLLELGRATYGEISPVVMNAYKELCISSEDLQQGLKYGKKALDIAIAVYGKKHPTTGWVYHYIGCIHRNLKQWEDALRYFQLGCETWYPAYGLHHEIMVSSYGNQSTCLKNLGRLDEALECNDKCLKVLVNTDDEDSYDYAITVFNRAGLLKMAGKIGEARIACQKSIDVLNGNKIKYEARSLDLIKICKTFIGRL